MCRKDRVPLGREQAGWRMDGNPSPLPGLPGRVGEYATEKKTDFR